MIWTNQRTKMLSCNRSSDNSEPSDTDWPMALRLELALTLLHIWIMDHLVLSGNHRLRRG
jgi:DNA repair protein RadC